MPVTCQFYGDYLAKADSEKMYQNNIMLFNKNGGMTIVAFDLNTVDSSQGQLNIDLCQEPIRAPVYVCQQRRASSLNSPR